MSRYRFRPNIRQEHFDPARGLTRTRLDHSGAPAEVELADGSRITLTRDASGNLRGLESGDFRLHISPPDTASVSLRVFGSCADTNVRWTAGSTDIRRGASSLRMSTGPHGFLTRVEFPGLDDALDYEWRDDGCCTITTARGAVLAEILPAKSILRVETALGAWEQSRTPAKIRFQAWGSNAVSHLSVEADYNALGRVLSRRWSDGAVETFDRDSEGRLTGWTRTVNKPDLREYCYHGAHLTSEINPTGAVRRAIDGAGRVLSVSAPDCPPINYQYDACGRRTVRQQGAHITRYTYDVLGQMTALDDSASGHIDMEYDGFGSRVRYGSFHECRDPEGRLWRVTDATGAPIHTYLWLHGRILARIDGALDSGLGEAYVCDHLGTPVMTLRDGGVDCVATQPFGECTSSAQPSIYGHFGDPVTGLIHFGAREYDPALGVFLTPDPFDGSPADPRRWAGVPEGELREVAEIPHRGTHPYALCRFDPVGRADLDGHKAEMPSTAISVLNGIFDVILMPTWAWPLTAISLYFFLPLDLVLGELIRGIVLAASGKNRWFEQHTIAKSYGPTGSSRQGIIALGLNGILPRLASSMFDPQADRAVTVGNIIWINKEELSRMDRPTVLEMATLSTWNTSVNTDSVLHIEGTGTAGKQFHASYWSRGFGNAVKEAAGIQSFDDKPFTPTDSAATSLIPVHLSKPFPQAFPVKATTTLKATEYTVIPTGTPFAQAEIVQGVFFALQMDPKSGVVLDDFLEIVASGLDPVHQKVVLIDPENDFDTVLLASPLPAAFKDKSYKVTRVVVDPLGVEIPAWTNDGPKKLKTPAADPLDPFQKLLTASRVRIESAPGPAPVGVPGAPPPAAASQISFATVKQATVKVKLSTPLDTAADAAMDVYQAVESGAAAHGPMDDPTAAPQTVVKIKWTVKGSVSKGDFVTISAGMEHGYANVTDTSATEVTLKLLGPPLTAAAATVVDIKTLKDLDSDDFKASVITAGVDDIPMKFGVHFFAPDNIVHFHKGDLHQFRTVKTWSEMDLELSEDPAGPAPYKVKGAVEDTTFKRQSGIELSALTRFLKYKTGKKPDECGNYPAVLHRFFPTRPWGHVDVFGAQFMAHIPAAGTSPFDPGFRGTWKSATVGADLYFVLDHDLLIRKKNGKGLNGTDRWTIHGDPDSSNEDSDYAFIDEPATNTTPTFLIDILELSLSAAPVQQNFKLSSPRVCVPEHPLVADTFADALREHELHHALQATHWGPMMGALPFAGLQTLIVDFDGAKDNAHPAKWLQNSNPSDEGLKDLQGLQYVSIGGIIESTWKYLFTLGKFEKMNFEEWNRILNPFFGNLIKYIGGKSGEDVDPNQPISSSPARAAFQLIATVQDLRSWIPFIGFVLLINPDGPRSFLEQGASRASGDLYSTILSADDKFNRKCTTRGGLIPMSTSTDANLVKPLGELARLMVFPGSRDDRVFPVAAANTIPKPPLTYSDTYNVEELVSIKPLAAALFHPRLYERLSAAAIVSFKIDGPLSDSTPVEFDRAVANDLFRPRLRALTPLPPPVLRTAGFYFIPASTGSYDIKAYHYADATGPDGSANSNANDSNDAKTQNATLTFTDGKVKFGDDSLPYEEPPASAATPVAPATKPALARFLTEQIDLSFGDQFTGADPDDKHPGAGTWELNLHTTPLAAVGDLLRVVDGPPKPHGWKLEMGKTVGTARVRVFRIFLKNDSNDDAKNDHAFDLLYDAEHYPSLKNVRSYLNANIWILVRDFAFEIKDLPKLTADGNAISIDSSKDQKFDLPLALTGENKPVIVATWDRSKPRPVPDPGNIPVPALEKLSDKSTFPKGQIWRMKPLDVPIEEDSTYKVSVTYGADPFNKVTRDVAVTITPVIRLKRKTAELPFEVSPLKTCELVIEGGSEPFSVDAKLPSGVTKSLSGRTITIAMNKPPAAAETKVVVTVSSGDNKGQRTITVRNT